MRISRSGSGDEDLDEGWDEDFDEYWNWDEPYTPSLDVRIVLLALDSASEEL